MSKPAVIFSESLSLTDKLQFSLQSGNARHRLKVLRGVTDLFLSGSRRYSDEQIALFDDILLQLIKEIEVSARARLSRQLTTLDNAPPRLIRSLAVDEVI
jgi:uncharacterized protein (DUF2336 family)